MSDSPSNENPFRFSRRGFIKTAGPTATAALSGQVDAVAEEMEQTRKEKPIGPAPVALELHVNGKKYPVQVEPRVTLLDVLRNELDFTGSKAVCDRAQCGACTVLLDGEPVNACMLLAVAVQGRKIRTIEGISPNGKMNKLQEEFVKHDAMQCGFCTPGFVTSLTRLLEVAPNATDEQIRKACSGHLCRCGTYPHILKAARAAAGRPEVQS